MSEFSLPLAPRDRGWLELRERFANTAREIHFYAVSNQAVNGSALLAIAGSFARLAMSIPLPPSLGEHSGLADTPAPCDAPDQRRELRADGNIPSLPNIDDSSAR